MVTLSIDVMSGDHGLSITMPAVLEVIQHHQDVKLILVGNESEISEYLKDSGEVETQRLTIHHASEVVGMADSPANALRQKKDSSMRVAINLVKSDQSDACVSAGNTGALMATARFVLKTIPGIDRPAICARLPRGKGCTYMLDLGANIDSPAAILYQFGLMGSLLLKCLDGNDFPTIGLLNIGVEEIKGNTTIRDASDMFKKSPLNYIGFVEADDIYMGDTDLIVCDGFVGNVALKTSEGIAQMFMGATKKEFSRNILTKSAGLLAKPVLNAIKNRLDHRRYNGASFLGLKGTVVKSHGNTDAVGFRCAIEVAIEEARSNLVNQIENALSSSLSLA
ncbi:MAG: phosphate acyltransferase PlsX [Gammaproteobacteria bacterium]|nr:phosphate acyltransferase PlsX [Gammaproteobacteria bacterium]